MTIEQAPINRHSVRRFTEKELDMEAVEVLQRKIAEINEKKNMAIHLVLNESEAFDNLFSHYGWLQNARNYLLLAGKDDTDLERKCGYYGEHLVLLAQQLGINSCWIGGMFKKKTVSAHLSDKERAVLVVVLGYGKDQGKAHRSKKPEEIMPEISSAPDWVKRGVEFALLAPTAVNQQKFRFRYLEGNRVQAQSGRGSFTKVDLGIAMLHFEIGAQREIDWQLH